MLFGSCNIQKLTESDFLEKFLSGHEWAKRAQNGKKNKFFSQNILSLVFHWKWSTVKYHIVIAFLVQTSYLAKFLFLNYTPEFSHLIRLTHLVPVLPSYRNQSID